MGGAISKRISRWNFQSRAQKKITEAPKKSPWHESTAKKLEEFMDSHPEIASSQNSKDDNLLERLKQVKVNSYGPPPKDVGRSFHPEARRNLREPIYGFVEPESTPEGTFTLSEGIYFLNKHNADPKNYTAEIIAKEYKLNVKDVENVLDYFKPVQLHIPTQVFDKYPWLKDKLTTVDKDPGPTQNLLNVVGLKKSPMTIDDSPDYAQTKKTKTKP